MNEDLESINEETAFKSLGYTTPKLRWSKSKEAPIDPVASLKEALPNELNSD